MRETTARYGHRRATPLLALAAVLGARAAAGQDYVAASETYQHVVEIPSQDREAFDRYLAQIAELQRLGDLLKAQEQAKVLLAELIETAADLKPHLSIDKQPVNLVWSTTDDTGKPIVAQLVVYSRPRIEHVRELPGLEGNKRRLRDVYLQRYDAASSDKKPGHFLSAYVSTPKASAASASLADFIARVPIVGFAAKSLGQASLSPASVKTLDAARLADSQFPAPNLARIEQFAKIEPPAKKHWLGLTISYFDLPDSSADLVGKYWVWKPRTGETVENIAKKTDARLQTREGLFSPCTRAVSSHVRAELLKAEIGQSCEDPAVFDRAAAAQLDAKCDEALKKATDQGYATAVGSSECREDPGRWPEAPLRAADAYAAALKKQDARGEASLSNVARVRYSLGLMTALMLGDSSLDEEHPRVKLNDDGVIVEDPLDRQLLAAIINIHPRAYRPTSRTMTAPERFRAFVGPVLSPDFGVTAGGGVGVFRGLGVTGGFTILFSETLREGDSLDQAPSNRSNPFQTRRHWLWSVGLSYAFK